MIAALRTGTAHTVLRQLSVLGASIESRGDKIVVRVGVRPVPPELIAAARASKAELAKMLTVAEDAHQRKDDHLRPTATANPRISAAFSEDAQSCENHDLREPLNAFSEAEDFQGSSQPEGSPAPDAVPKVLTEDTQMSAFEQGKDFCGFQSGSTPKARNSAHVNTFGTDERLRPPWGEAEEERAAIAEYEGAIPRAWAEGFGRLDPEHPPGDVPPKRWLRFVDDVGHFLDSSFCAVAAALGWGPYDLFGCDRDRPFARIDCAGLLWLLNGDRLVGLTATTATIETATGNQQRWRKKRAEPFRVLAWELIR
jgi:hypothetical protein